MLFRRRAEVQRRKAGPGGLATLASLRRGDGSEEASRKGRRSKVLKRAGGDGVASCEARYTQEPARRSHVSLCSLLRRTIFEGGMPGHRVSWSYFAVAFNPIPQKEYRQKSPTCEHRTRVACMGGLGGLCTWHVLFTCNVSVWHLHAIIFMGV